MTTPTPLTPLTRPPRPRRPGRRRRAQRARSPRSGSRPGLDILRGWDLDPVVAPHVLDRHAEFDYLAGTDADRAADLQAAWCDPAVDAVLCARGGYGAQRMVDLLDWDAMRAAGPKVFVGFSDITALHEAFATRPGLVTLHGPDGGGRRLHQERAGPGASAGHPVRAGVGAHDRAPNGTRAGARAGPGRHPRRLPQPARRRPRHPARPRLRPGRAAAASRTSARRPYRLDRILTQLLRAGWLDGVAGIALGSWAECGPYERLRARASRTGSAGSGCRWSRSSGSGTARGR